MNQAVHSAHFYVSSGLAASQLWGIKMREGKVPARAPAFTSAYVNTESFSTEKQGVIIKPFSDFCLIPHRGNKAGLELSGKEIVEI